MDPCWSQAEHYEFIIFVLTKYHGTFHKIPRKKIEISNVHEYNLIAE